jgi:predicted peptidase
VKSNQTAQLFEQRRTQQIRAEYLLFLPSDYAREGPGEWPLLLFLHGAGERGTNLARVSAHGPPRLAQQRPDFPFVVVSPQCPRGQSWSSEILTALLDEVVLKYRIDQQRIYVTGLSMGGYGTWDLALTHPERFAAAVPICGGGDILPILLATGKKLVALRRLAIWAFHGAKDSVVPVQETEHMVTALRTVGSHPKLTIYRDAEHDSWSETYDNPVLYQWLLAQTRGRRARSVAAHPPPQRRS